MERQPALLYMPLVITGIIDSSLHHNYPSLLQSAS